ncbi:DEAD/DEAH box helicase [Paenibacillus woosongensis]|uniref:DEAD/DEAH box helicase n=1 Tax=Paenibacillus woosongensis TaxID=307580 RepID=A0AA95I7K8_9BACL|nr:DEAD/DEAH box helicase [Paenibacillus woosongensis]WHX50766.1 DEAD/DEAH box helicase [Paenibacillus woosongensis]
MSFQLTTRVIKLLCGKASFEQGNIYVQAGRVYLNHTDPEAAAYTATVRGNESYSVRIAIDSDGDVKADCSCPVYGNSDHYCGHVAAVLIAVHDLKHDGAKPVRTYSLTAKLDEAGGRGLRAGNTVGARISGMANMTPRFRRDSMAVRDTGMTKGILKIFDDRQQGRFVRTNHLADLKTPLEVEIICKLHPYRSQKHLFGIELKVGTKRLYIVQKIREFLDCVERGEPYEFSKHFTYVPELHYFQPQDDVVIRQLQQICRNERMYQETNSKLGSYSAYDRLISDDRLLLVPPFAWDALQPLLSGNSAVHIMREQQRTHAFEISNDRIPLQFEFDAYESGGYQLRIEGLDELIVLEAYGLVLAGDKLIPLPAEQCSRLSELKHMLYYSRSQEIYIAAEQMEPFIEKVVPGLRKLGVVQMSKAISGQIVHAALTARLYLDRVRDRLLAGLEFQYGDIVFNPLAPHDERRGESRIIMRDGDKEAQILSLMETGLFAQTESGYFLDDEDDEYEFLYRVLPELEKLVHVYATSAVKARLYTEHEPPQIRIDVDERTDWLEFKFEMQGIPEAEIKNILSALEEKRKYYRMPDGALLPLESSEFQEMVKLMNEVGIRQFDLNGTEIRLPAVRGLHFMNYAGTGNNVKLGKSLRRLLDHMRNPDHLDFPVPEQLDAVLRDYQKYGYQWMKTLAHYRFGGILADDMGLGKTLQSIAFIVSVLPEIRQQDLPALIVAPASLMYNWENELRKFAPDIKAVIVDGSRTERGRAMRNSSNIDVIITSYPLLRRDVDLYEGRSFHTLVLDEAQAFKNHTTQTAQAVKSIYAKYRFALTGTPIENSLEELWSIFEAVFPDLFPGRKEFNELSRETIARRIRPFLLRRLKSDVLKELPEKIETLQASELLPEQKKLYLAYLAKLQQETLKNLDQDDFKRNRIKILAGLTRLRQLCCHPGLFVEDYNGSSAKFEQLLEIVEECRSAGKRMLIFSQFTEMLGMIGRELGYEGVPFFYLDGSTPAAERVELCNRFNDGEKDVFLISLKAGGTGLNLTGADTVILYDLWWNPAVEEQAADRAHRMGQKKVVHVIRLVTQGTVEDKMYELQQKKKNLIDEVIQPGQETLSSLTEEEIREILMI